MKSVFVVVLALGSALAAPPTVHIERSHGRSIQGDDASVNGFGYEAEKRFIPITSMDHRISGSKAQEVHFTTANGISVSERTEDEDRPSSHQNERGEIVTSDTTLVKTGSISYTSPEGRVINLNYIADEYGYRPQGDHLPRVPQKLPEVLQAEREHLNAVRVITEQREGQVQVQNQQQSYQVPQQTVVVQKPEISLQLQNQQQSYLVQQPQQSIQVVQPQQSFQVKPQQTFQYQKPQQTFQYQKPQQSFQVQRPQQSIQVQNSQESYVVQNPQQTYQVQRPQQTYQVQRPQQTYQVQRPQQTYQVQRPQQTYQVQKPQQSYEVQKPQQSYEVQNQQSYFVQKPQQSFQVQRPQQSYEVQNQQQAFQVLPAVISPAAQPQVFQQPTQPPVTTPKPFINQVYRQTQKPFQTTTQAYTTTTTYQPPRPTTTTTTTARPVQVDSSKFSGQANYVVQTSVPNYSTSFSKPVENNQQVIIDSSKYGSVGSANSQYVLVNPAQYGTGSNNGPFILIDSSKQSSGSSIGQGQVVLLGSSNSFSSAPVVFVDSQTQAHSAPAAALQHSRPSSQYVVIDSSKQSFSSPGSVLLHPNDAKSSSFSSISDISTKQVPSVIQFSQGTPQIQFIPQQQVVLPQQQQRTDQIIYQQVPSFVKVIPAEKK